LSAIFTCDNHSAVYAHLRTVEAPVFVVHLDAHCDMRGLYVDRSARRARRHKGVPVSASTWLGALVLEGCVRRVEWIHDEVGGRANDLHTVRYASDRSHIPYRWRPEPRGAPIPFEMSEAPFDGWRQTQPDVVLDLDWDFFADPRKPESRRRREVETFFTQVLVAEPMRVYCAYSPHYAVPDRGAYRDFVARLSAALDLPVYPLVEPPRPPHRAARALPPLARTVARRSALFAKRQLWRFNGLGEAS
jgi:hypothetical protein